MAQVAFADRGGLCVLPGDGKGRQLSLRRPLGTPPPSTEGGKKAGGIAKAGKYGALDLRKGARQGQAVVKRFLACTRNDSSCKVLGGLVKIG